MMKMLRNFFVMTAILSLAACQQVVRPVNDNEINGIYYLLKVDDTTLPGTVYHDDVALEIHSGTFIISADGTCFSRTRFTAPGGEEVTREAHAQYVLRGSRLVMTWEGAGMTEGTVEGDSFVMDNHGMIFEYTRNP